MAQDAFSEDAFSVVPEALAESDDLVSLEDLARSGFAGSDVFAFFERESVE